MFDLWRISTKILKIIPEKKSVFDTGKRIMKIGKNIEAIIDDKETILLKKKQKNQVRIVRSKTIRSGVIMVAKPISIPNVEAMPLPPLNSKNIVQLCPHTHTIPKIIRNSSTEIKD